MRLLSFSGTGHLWENRNKWQSEDTKLHEGKFLSCYFCQVTKSKNKRPCVILRKCYTLPLNLSPNLYVNHRLSYSVICRVPLEGGKSWLSTTTYHLSFSTECDPLFSLPILILRLIWLIDIFLCPSCF